MLAALNLTQHGRRWNDRGYHRGRSLSLAFGSTRALPRRRRKKSKLKHREGCVTRAASPLSSPPSERGMVRPCIEESSDRVIGDADDPAVIESAASSAPTIPPLDRICALSLAERLFRSRNTDDVIAGGAADAAATTNTRRGDRRHRRPGRRSRHSADTLAERYTIIDGVDDERPTILHVASYGIGRTWDLLRHVYMAYRNVEIHAGMTTDGTPHLLYTTKDYFGNGRVEGYVVMCRECANDLVDRMSDKSRNFHILFNNCDTIVPYIWQTPLMWISTLSLLTGCCIYFMQSNDAYRYATGRNFYVFLLFVPILIYMVMLLGNKFARPPDRRDCLLRRCKHVTNKT